MKFQAHIKKVEFKKSYGDNLVTVILEPCYNLTKEIRSQLAEFQQKEEANFQVEIKEISLK